MKNIRKLCVLLCIGLLMLCTGCHSEVESTILTTGPVILPTESTEPPATVPETTALTEATAPAPEQTEPIPETTAPRESTAETTSPTESSEESTAPATEAARDYVLNNNSKKFHYPSCSSAGQIKPSNRTDFHGTRQELLDRGYSPCGRCKP